MRVSNRANYDLSDTYISDPSNVQTTLRRFRDNHEARWSLVVFLKNIQEYTRSKELHRMWHLLINWVLLNDSQESIRFIKHNHISYFQQSFQDRKDLLHDIPENILDAYDDLFCFVSDDKTSKIRFLDITIENLLKYIEKPEYFSIEWELPMIIDEEKKAISDIMKQQFSH